MSKTQIFFALILIAIIGVSIKGYTLYQAISPNAITYWNDSNERNKQQISHDLWADILSSYLFNNSQINTKGFAYSQVTPNDKVKLKTYLQQLQAIDPREYSKNEQLAYWVNLYNALTVNLIIEHYPLDSIKDIGDGFTGPWNLELAHINDLPVTLNQIEHGILRALWQEKRIHYVINCASIGCPDLPNKPFNSYNIEQQLNNAANRFINQPKGVALTENTLVLSSIYNWFSDDFGENTQALLEHIKHYAKPALKAKLNNFNNDTNNIKYAYNWKLNNTFMGHLNKHVVNKQLLNKPPLSKKN